jgi:IS4 transposase
VADRGFPQPNGIRNTLAQGADVLVRLTWNSLQLTTQDGEPIEWLGLLEKAAGSGPLDIPVYMHKAHSTFEPLLMRMVIIEKPPAAAAKACAKAKRASSKNQRRTDPRTLAAAGHVILLTSLKPEEFSTKALAALYRLRWQIELAFKRLKSILHIDRLPAKDPNLARAWLYAHLIFALILDSRSAELDALSPSGIQ